MEIRKIKMEINIWSDVRCPFCYIGKHRFEKALGKFGHRDKVKIHWRSFELDPGLKTDPEINAQDHLAQHYGVSQEKADQMASHARQSAKDVGLSFNFENLIIANSFNAHQVIHYAQSVGLGIEAKEALFRAYFVDCLNIDDTEELVALGIKIGLDGIRIKEVIESDEFSDAVRSDQKEARSIGVKGVPFFVFDNKYAVSDAQSPEMFLQTLQQSFDKFSENN